MSSPANHTSPVAHSGALPAHEPDAPETIVPMMPTCCQWWVAC